MAATSKRGGAKGPGGGRLIGVFFLLTLMMGTVFTLGYLLGRSQYDPQLRAAVVNIAGEPSLPGHAKPTADHPAGKPLAKTPSRRAGADQPAPSRQPNDTPSPVNWDFYRSADPAKVPEKLSPRAQTSPAPNASAPAANPPAAPPPKSKTKNGAGSATPRVNAPLIPKGTVTLQVAALAHESDAVNMAQMLRQKKFPAFVLSPDTDKFYRVQVGPYKDAKSADAARQRLEAAGFKTITKK